MIKTASEMADMLEKLASELEATANKVEETKQTKTASEYTDYGSLDTSIAKGSSEEAFVSWITG